jgi:hypothetical protein
MARSSHSVSTDGGPTLPTMTRRALWVVAGSGVVVGSLTTLGGVAGGGAIGQVAVVYGPVIGLTALMLVIRLAMRDRPWRRLRRRVPGSRLIADRLQGRRIF